MNTIQLTHPTDGRLAAIVEGDKLRPLKTYQSIYAAARAADAEDRPLADLLAADAGDETLDYAAIYEGSSPWRLLPAFDHPEEPARCMVSGTGLTHKHSALNRQAMHAGDGKSKDEPVTDSMRIFQWGLEGGRPEPGKVGVQPEWFYKGTGLILRGCNAPLRVPSYADDGGDEAEIAGCYLIDRHGRPRRVGMAMGNEFSDHVMEKQNYLYLAPSKLRTCAIGPELVLDPDFDDVHGEACVKRGGETIWSHAVVSGEANMSHTVANLEHHQFKYSAHRRPGDVHVHFFGADAFSYGQGVKLENGDVMEVTFPGFGRPLRNPVEIDGGHATLVEVKPL